jgi:predicted HTH transcriptional regulator
MAKKIKINSIDNNELKKVINLNQNKTIKDKVLEVFKENPEFNRAELAEILGVSRKTIYKHLK